MLSYTLIFLKRFGPGCGYCPKPSGSVLIVHSENLKDRNFFGLCHGFRVCTGTCCLGGYIRDDEYKGGWIKTGTDKWERNICAVTKTAEKYIQEGYAAVDRAI